MNAKEKSKERWDNCAKIAEHLNIQKTLVHEYLWAEISGSGLIEKAVEGDPETLDRIRQMHGWRRMNNRPRVYDPPVRTKDDRPSTPEEKLKIALWFINKLGSAEEAKRAIEAAAVALEKFR